MLEFLPKDVREGLRAAQLGRVRRRSRLRVTVGAVEYPVLRLWADGLALDAGATTHLRGLVDVYDGARHVLQCLIIASEVEAGELICSFKRSTTVTEKAPLDYWRDENAPVGYLPKA